MARKKVYRKAKGYEKRKAKEHRGKHLGGPRQPDYIRGNVKAEVKNWARPVHSGVIKQAKQKGIKEIVSKSGFTQPAIELAKKYGIELLDRQKRIT